jgi:DNA-binding SARP family transcriptional activator
VALDVVDTAFTPEHGRRFDDTVVQLAANPRLAPFTALIAAEYGIVLVRQGQMDVARRYLDDAEKALGTTLVTHTTSLRCRRLRGLLLLADGSAHEGRAVLDAIRREAAAEGRVALVTLIETDLAEQHRPPATAQRRRPVPSPVVVQVLAPELALSVDGEAVPTPRGYPAKLLVLLVVSNGLMTLDAAIERLWPGADPDIGRNRLHGVLLRLRRTMGLPAGGPISCTEGLVRLHQSPQVQIDSWEFEHLAARADSRPDARAEAIAAYRGDVLSAQFAYDDTVAAYRRNLRRTFLRHATALLTDPPEAFEAGALASLARRAYRLAPDDDNVCRVAARTLTCLGHHAEAGELLDGTARTLVELGSARNDSARP